MDEYLLSRISDRSIKVKTVGGPQIYWLAAAGQVIGVDKLAVKLFFSFP